MVCGREECVVLHDERRHVVDREIMIRRSHEEEDDRWSTGIFTDSQLFGDLLHQLQVHRLGVTHSHLEQRDGLNWLRRRPEAYLATRNGVKYMPPADIRVWDLLRKYVKTKEDERLAKKKERLAKKDERLAKKDERLDKTDERLAKTDERLALLGSPGCGKSSMVQLLAVVMAKDDKKDVLYLQHVSGGYTKFHLFTPKSCVSGVLLNFDLPRLVQLLAVIDGRTLNPFIIVDGFTDTSLKLLRHYDLVVTSGAFNDSSMGSNLLLLPSWSLEDVVQLGFQANMLSEEEIKKRYAHFGGDLRSIFNADQKAADRALYAGLDRVSDENVSLLLSGSGRCSKNQVDRVCRFRVKYPSLDEHFQNPSHWIGDVESSTVQRAFLNELPLQWFDKLLRHAVGTTLHGNADEMSIQARAAHKQKLRFESLVCLNPPIAPRRGAPRAAKGESPASVLETNPALLTALSVVIDTSAPI